jgi:RNA polymerase sigma-70 factor (ECF subfamily)
MAAEGSSPAASPTDEALVERVKSGDARAHRLLFDRYYARVFAFLQRRLRDRELAEETAADVFFEIWRHSSAFRGASRVSTWVFGIAHFKFLEADRKRRRLKRSAVLPGNVELLHRVADEHDLGTEVSARSELRRVGSLLRELPREQRDTVELALLEGLSYEEIGARLGVPEGTVKARVARARARLRSGIGLAPREDGT